MLTPFTTISYNLKQYPNIVPLQAIVGQGAAQAPSQADQSAATAAANPAGGSSTGSNNGAEESGAATAAAPSSATTTAGAFTSFNPMAWLSAPPATTGDTPDEADAANHATV